MASSDGFSFTDEEMLEELRKLGYPEVSPEIFQMLKEDIKKLAEQVESNAIVLESSPNLNARPSTSFQQPSISISPVSNDNHMPYNRISKSPTVNEQKFNSKVPILLPQKNVRGLFNHDNGNVEKSPSSDSRSTSSSGGFTHFSGKNANNAENKAERDINNLDEESSINSNACKTIKRKVMRHRNGQAVITEQLLSVSEFTSGSSDNAQSNESSSSDDVSFQSSGSAGSLLHPVPRLFTSNRSTSSLSSTKSAPPRIGSGRRKKSDPVAMYNYYRKFWDNFKPPGEKSHDKLRWTVRDKMLDYG